MINPPRNSAKVSTTAQRGRTPSRVNSATKPCNRNAITSATKHGVNILPTVANKTTTANTKATR